MTIRRLLRARPGAPIWVAARKCRVAAVSLAAAAIVALSATGSAAGPASFPLHEGYFFTQTGDGEGLGYAIRDETGAGLWTAFQDLGGHEVLGYPVSQPWREGPFAFQAFQRALLQAAPDGQVRPANIYDLLSAAGHDAWLETVKGVPPASFLPPDAGPLARMEALAVAPEIQGFWRDAPNALSRFGLPLGYASSAEGGVLRAQRAVLRLHEGVVRLAPAGDHFKQAGMIPSALTTPVAPPRIPRPLVDAHSLLVTSVAFDPSGVAVRYRWIRPESCHLGPGDLDARLRTGRPLRRYLRSRLLARRFRACQCFRG